MGNAFPSGAAGKAHVIHSIPVEIRRNMNTLPARKPRGGHILSGLEGIPKEEENAVNFIFTANGIRSYHGSIPCYPVYRGQIAC